MRSKEYLLCRNIQRKEFCYDAYNGIKSHCRLVRTFVILSSKCDFNSMSEQRRWLFICVQIVKTCAIYFPWPGLHIVSCWLTHAWTHVRTPPRIVKFSNVQLRFSYNDEITAIMVSKIYMKKKNTVSSSLFLQVWNVPEDISHIWQIFRQKRINLFIRKIMHLILFLLLLTWSKQFQTIRPDWVWWCNWIQRTVKKLKK